MSKKKKHSGLKLMNLSDDYVELVTCRWKPKNFSSFGKNFLRQY